MEQTTQATVAEKKVQIVVNEELWTRVKASAALQRREISDLANEALQQYMSSREVGRG